MTTPIVPSITDDQIDEFERAVKALDASGINQRIDNKNILALIARLRAAEAVCDDLRGDADRYRWLRDEANRTREDAPQVLITDWSGSPVSIQPWAYPQGEELDSAIDAAMEQQP